MPGMLPDALPVVLHQEWRYERLTVDGGEGRYGAVDGDAVAGAVAHHDLGGGVEFAQPGEYAAEGFVYKGALAIEDAGAEIGEVEDFGDGAPGVEFVGKHVSFGGVAGVGAYGPCKGLSGAVECAEVAFADGDAAEVGGMSSRQSCWNP